MNTTGLASDPGFQSPYDQVSGVVHRYSAHRGPRLFQFPLEDVPHPVHPVQLFGTAFRIDDFFPQGQHLLPVPFDICF